MESDKLAAAIDRAEELGAHDGADYMPSWVGDRPSRDWAAKWLADATLAGADRIGTISGADTWEVFAEHFTIDPEADPEALAEVCDAYRMGFEMGLADAVTRECQSILGIDPETGEPFHADLIGKRVEWPRGVASEIVGAANGPDALVLVMVGDDTEHTVTLCDLPGTYLDATNGDYCPGCGQVGRNAYGYAE